ncbi:MAG TPA: hypothetical protein VF744_11540 [Beijerinckiaceae bacterium]|jgi:predicted choloylglycine hydrolase
MKTNHDVRGLLSSLADAQAMATALGFGFVAFLIGMAILETCNAAEGEEDIAATGSLPRSAVG